MLPTTLYLIGNGFDLHHRIPSRYAHFKEYVKQHDTNLFEAVENYLPAGEEWNELESAMADVDVEGIIQDLEQFMPSYAAEDWSDSGHHDFQYEVENLVRRLSSELRMIFGKWVRALTIPTKNTATTKLSTLRDNAVFLTFNYTSTLRDLYAIPDSVVLHIHGRSDQPDSELVLGHAWDPAQRRSLNERPDIEDIDTRLMEANCILDEYFSSTFKHSDELIKRHHNFFGQLTAVDTVCVLGHSLSDVDLPYIQALLAISNVASAKWFVACLTAAEETEKYDRLIELGVEDGKAHTVLWSDL